MMPFPLIGAIICQCDKALPSGVLGRLTVPMPMERIRLGRESVETEFRLNFTASSPISKVVLTERGLMGHVLIRGEDYSGCTAAVSALCGDAAMAGFGVIYISEGLVPTLAASLRTKAHAAFGAGRYYSLHVCIEKGRKFKVSRQAVSVLHFDSHTTAGSVEEVRRRIPGILDWIKMNSIESPLLLVLENYHLYCNEFVVDLLDRANKLNCAVILTTLGSDPRVESPAIDVKVFEKCATILNLNRRRASDLAE
jgi:hypothetical protein